MPTIKITCWFPITLQQQGIKDFCRQFDLEYVRHTQGGEPNDYWLVVEVNRDVTPEECTAIQQALAAHILASMVTVSFRKS